MVYKKIITGFILLMLLVLFTPFSNGKDKNREVLGVLKEGYLRNREAFPFINCKFEWREGKAVTRKDAIEGRFFEELKKRQGYWLVDEPVVRYELLCSPDLAKETKRILEEGIKKKDFDPKVGIFIPCADRLFLRSDSYSLRYGPMNLCANLFSKDDKDPEGIRVTPFNPDCLGPDEYSSPALYLQQALDGRWETEFNGTVLINGIPALAVLIAGRQKFGFDPKKGYLMVYASDKDPQTGKRYYEVNVIDTRECSRDRWFPTRIVSIISPDTGGPFEVRELKVLSLDVDSKPATDLFQITLASGVQVSVIERMEWIQLNKSLTVSPQDLPGLQNRMKKNGDAYLARLAAEEGKISPYDLKKYLPLIFFSFLAIVLLCVFFFKRWKSNNNPPPIETGK